VVPVGQSFSVNVTVSSVSDLYGWEFELGWNSTLLDVTSVDEGTFLQAGGNTFFTYQVDSIGGGMIADCTLVGDIPGVSGSGTLASAAFHVKEVGDCPLTLYNVTLYNSYVNTIPLQAVGGYGYFTLYQGHDVAVIAVEPSKTIVGKGFCSSIAVTVKNYGSFNETFNTTAYANATAIQTHSTDLTAGNSTRLTFTWNTTGFPYGNYAISAYATPVPGETYTANNNYTDGVVCVGVPGDVDGNGLVNMIDLYKIALCFGSCPGTPSYDPNCDVDGNGLINMMDLYIAALYYGQSNQ
jgi:hypothetical protein